MHAFRCLGKRCEYLPTVADGIEGQKILDSLLESSESGKWINIK